MPEFINGRCSAIAFSIAALAVAVSSGLIFRAMHEAEPIISGPGVTTQSMLSAQEPSLAGTDGDTPVFELKGEKPGATMMILGGTHRQEIAGAMAAILMVDNARVAQGRINVVPQANRSGFTHTVPIEASRHS